MQEDKTVKIEERPIPELKPNEILLKTKSIGLNPGGMYTYDLLWSYAKYFMFLFFVDWKVSRIATHPFKQLREPIDTFGIHSNLNGLQVRVQYLDSIQ